MPSRYAADAPLFCQLEPYWPSSLLMKTSAGFSSTVDDAQNTISTPHRFFVQVKLAVGSALSTAIGLFVGLLIPGDGDTGHLFLIVVCGFCGWLFRLRRGRSVLATIGICFVVILLSWPIALALRDASHVQIP